MAASQLSNGQKPRTKMHPKTTNKKLQIDEEHKVDLQGQKLCQSMCNMRLGQINASKTLLNAAATNTANAHFRRAPSNRSLAHIRLTRPMLLLTRKADFNRVGPLLQLLARLPRLLGFFRHCLKARRQGKRSQGVATNKRLQKDRHGKYRLFVLSRIQHA